MWGAGEASKNFTNIELVFKIYRTNIEQQLHMPKSDLLGYICLSSGYDVSIMFRILCLRFYFF